MTPNLDDLINQVAALPTMTAAQRRQQRINFAYGNVRIHNPTITLEMVLRAAEKIDSEGN